MNDENRGLWLVAATKAALAWFFRIQNVYIRGQPLATLSLIAAVLGERVFSLLAFFLPLKVLLMAGSDGVPRYFAFFMDVEEKPFWLGVLAGAAVVFYLVAVALEKFSSMIAGRAGEGVLKGANEIYVTSLQRKEASTYFLQFATVSASVTLVVLSLIVMGLINPWLPGVLVVLMMLEFAFPAAVIQRTVSRGRPVSESWITSSWQGYLSACRSINFLSGFGVLLASFLLGAQGNVIWAVLAIIILRQSLTAGASVVGLLIGLNRKRPSIDPLTFRESRLIRQDMPESRDFRILFEHERRAKLLRDVFNGLGYGDPGFSSVYRDGTQRGIYEFLITLAGSEQRFLLNVFSKQRISLLEHENLLFDYIGRASVNAPSVLAEFAEGPFQCQLLRLGSGDFAASRAWQSLGPELYGKLCFRQLPDSLIQDYLVSHQSIDERITDELISRTVVALDTPRQKETFEAFKGRIPEIRALIRRVPLRLQNRDLLARNIVVAEESPTLITNWLRWSVDRIGAIMPPTVEIEALAQTGHGLLGSTIHSTSSGGGNDADLIRLVKDLVAIEQSISAEGFNRALEQMRGVLDRVDLLQSTFLPPTDQISPKCKP